MAKSLGFHLTYHTHDSRRSNPGFPDLVLLNARSGRLIFVELKAQSGRVRPEQETWINALRAGGHTAELWRPADWLSGRIMDVLRGVRSA